MYKKILNYFVIIAALFSVSLLSACSDDKDSDLSGDIVGKWDMCHAETWRMKNGEIFNRQETDIPSGSAVIVFEKSGKFKIYQDGGEESGKYKLSGDKLTVYSDENNGKGKSVTLICEINNDLLTLTESNEGEGYEYFEKLTFKRID